MKDSIRICVLAVTLALSIVVAPAQAWTDGASGDRPALSWWDAMVDTLATLFGLDGADTPPSSPPQGEGSCMIDPDGRCHS